MSKRNLPRPIPGEEECHPHHPQLPRPSWVVPEGTHRRHHTALSAAEVLRINDQPRRVADVLRGHCQSEELLDWRKFASEMLICPFTASWTDADEEGSSPVQILALEVLRDEDRRGVFVKCAIVGTSRLRSIPLECLVVEEVPDVQFDASNPQHIAGRIIRDYVFWIQELHGLDPSYIFFEDDVRDDFPFQLGSPDADFEEEGSSYHSGDQDPLSPEGHQELGHVLERMLSGQHYNDDGVQEEGAEDFDIDDWEFGEGDEMDEDGSHHGDDLEEEEEESAGEDWKIAYSDSDGVEGDDE